MVDKRIAWLAAILFTPGADATAVDDAARMREIEQQLRVAQTRVTELEATLAALAADVASLHADIADRDTPAVVHTAGDEHAALPTAELTRDARRNESEQRDRVLAPRLGADERGATLEPRPELFLQIGYAARRVDDAGSDATTRFMLNRVEARWSGEITDRLGLGVEIQYHPAPAGAPEELVNDAFVEYYASDALTVRVGQFIKPFGFDVQQSSNERESPERALFAGYFFPGQRDRGALVAADMSKLGHAWTGVSLYGGVFNGNRFFDDDNDALNVNLRFRKSFPLRAFAVGASVQSGTQLLPPGVTGTDRANVVGVDAQWLAGPLGVRVEYARGNAPSTLLGLEPEFAPSFEPGIKSWGAAATFALPVNTTGELYWRWDRFAFDPVTGDDVRALNLGYILRLSALTHVGFDYQWKNRPSFNDDALNTRLAIRWSVLY